MSLSSWPLSDGTAACHATVDKNLSTLLDFSRWVSATIVLLSHSRSIFFVPWGEVASPDVVSLTLYTVSGWGDYGVLAFFAISGYLIGGGTLEKMREGRFAFSYYLMDRFSRIYIVLVPALVLVWVLDGIGLHWLNGSGIYSQAYPVGALPYPIGEVIGMPPFIANALMLQNFATPPFGTAQPLWSLSWEWWSYMVSPFLIGLLLRVGGWSAAVLAVVIGVGMVAGQLGYMLLWHLGILLALIRLRSKWLLAVGVLLCAGMPLATRSGVLAVNLLTQTAFLLGFVLLLSQLRHLRLPDWWFRLPNQWLASFSYSLYVLHTTILVFLMAGLQTFADFPRQFQPGGYGYALYLGFCLVAFVAAYGFASLTEFNTRAFRRWLTQRLLASQPVSR